MVIIMMVVYFIAGMIGIFGICLTVYNLFMIFSWLFANRIEAIIIDLNSEVWNHGRIRFCYQYQWSGKIFQTWGPWYESFNPFLIAFPKFRLGKMTIIHVNTKKNKIIQSPFVSLVFIAVAAAIVICSIFIFMMV